MMSKIALILVSLYLVFFISGCSNSENLTESSTRLIVESLTGDDIEGNEGSTIAFSDVVTTSGSIVNDNAQANLTAQVLNPFQTTTTYYQDIIVDQVDVSYSRADGFNQEGRDVPYSFSQRVHARVTINGLTTLGFVIVQHNAKTEPPLIDLKGPGHEHILKLEARITFHSKDLGGQRLQPVVGYMSVWCADFGDEN